MSLRSALGATIPGRTLRALAWNLESRVWNRSTHSSQSREQLVRFRGRHEGERCFILGNGPSLARTDLTRLRGEKTFGLNRCYLLFPKLGFPTSFVVVINKLVIDQCAAEFRELSVPTFVSWQGRRVLPVSEERSFFRTHWESVGFSERPEEYLYEGATVTFAAMQLAFFMGFSTVILLGVDHSFATKGPAHRAVVSKGDDPNHFDPGYFGKGFRWQLPDLETSERAYSLARDRFATAGRSILDATLGGKLEVFPKVDYETLF